MSILKWFFGARIFTTFDMMVFVALCIHYYKGSIGIIMFIVLSVIADCISGALQVAVED